jgi:hypothetical protein
MGSSMLLVALSTPTDGSPPEWAAGREAIEQLTFADLTDGLLSSIEDEVAEDAVDDEEAVLAAAKARLHRRISELQAAYGDGQGELDRDLSFFHLCGRRMLTTGGPSWGGPPTELFDLVVDLAEIDKVATALAGNDKPVPPQAATPSIEPGQVLDIDGYGRWRVTAGGQLTHADVDQPLHAFAEIGAVFFLLGHGYFLIQEDTDLQVGDDSFPSLTPLSLVD